MTQINTLKDLRIAGGVSIGELGIIARHLFNGVTTYPIEGYDLTLPRFDDLPTHVQGFITKAILESSVVNILDKPKPKKKSEEQKADEIAEYAGFGPDGNPYDEESDD